MKGVKGSGYMSMTRTKDHTFKYSRFWFRTEEARDKYRWREITRRAAKRAGWPTSTDEELMAFHNHRENYRNTVRVELEREQAIRAERRKFKEELGLHPKANMTGHALKPTAPALPMLQRQADSKLNDKQRLDLIKRLIEERTPIQEFMIRTSQLVGAKL